jgi:SpoIVB peptidase S55
MRRPSLRSLRRPFSLGAVASLVVVATTLAAVPATAVGTCTPGGMPDVLATADMQPGMTGTAWTVVQGTTPVSFDVEILAVEQNVILPGHAFVLVRLSGSVIDATGGIAAGMSGSPVYINGQLAGALSYGGIGDNLAGMTPAEEMVQIFDNPGPTSPSQLPQTVTLSPVLRQAAARAEGVPYASTPTTANMIPTPLAVSGVSSRAMGRFKKMLKRVGLTNVIPYSAAAVSNAQPLSPTPLQPGDSYSAVISTGDLTSGGIGTETATCGDLSIAFGHPFNFDGPTSLGLNGANVVTVVADPLGLYSFKWADITEPHGTIDQDRFSGIRGIDGTYPDVIPITSHVANMDLSTERTGETDLLRQDFLPDYAAFHLLYNIDSTFDRVGDGTTTLSWSASGTADGTPWSFTRTNMFYSQYDTSYASIFEMYDFLYQIANYPNAKITVNDVHESAQVTQQQLTEQIKKVQWATNQHPTFTSNRVIPTKPYGLIQFRVTVLPTGSTTTQTLDFKVRVPANIRGNGRLEVRGGGQSGFFFLGAPGRAGRSAQVAVSGSASATSSEAASGSSSFNDLLNQLHNQDRGFDLITQIFAPGVDSTTRPGRVARPQPDVVFGQYDFALSINGGTVIGGHCIPGKPC